MYSRHERLSLASDVCVAPEVGIEAALAATLAGVDPTLTFPGHHFLLGRFFVVRLRIGVPLGSGVRLDSQRSSL